MIVGRGDIASVLPDRDDLLFFASGVSNSQETRREEFQREYDLLMAQNRYKHIVYFSTLARFYLDNPYTDHKYRMEYCVKNYFKYYTIIRLGNITWGTNPNTFLNYFRSKIKNGEEPEFKDEYRYMLEKEEFLHWINLIPKWNAEINIPGKRMKVVDAVRTYGLA